MTVASGLAALCASAAVVLLVSGLAKIARPGATATMLAELFRLTTPRLPRRPAVLRPVARGVGVAEVTVAALVLAVGGRVAAALLAVAYAAFVAVAARLAGRAVSCGCFGRDDSPVGRSHVVVTSVAAAVSAAGAVVAIPAGGGLFDLDGAAAAGGALLVVVLATLTYLSMTALPALSSARRLVEAS